MRSSSDELESSLSLATRLGRKLTSKVSEAIRDTPYPIERADRDLHRHHLATASFGKPIGDNDEEGRVVAIATNIDRGESVERCGQFG